MKRLPIFESFVSLLSCYLAVILLLNDNFFKTNPIVYDKLSNLADEKTMAAVFLVAALTKISGILFNITCLRLSGLVMSSIIYLTIAVTYFMGHVLWGLGIFSLLALFCIISIIDIKHTKL